MQHRVTFGPGGSDMRTSGESQFSDPTLPTLSVLFHGPIGLRFSLRGELSCGISIDALVRRFPLLRVGKRGGLMQEIWFASSPKRLSELADRIESR